ncbi:MFS transporter, PAT family, beta-lactamase induction signal transducer AmpG [Atopomonas hussainii]|uniref:MFS transporter, PAT family, beta-lactamase induction signal transducer AmpG n=1 Tax=Atopomonas hussainii TaxID=1429083 RepID=A0A1H7M095_9GAMM|nr:AmpG family muropeptide MFS transporter [Atopomonas hussainii]SEL03997.1 MFS transporter, PAT family, beta-lactamase induction signal transducer AmpG [Atopomonas hussainii]
MTQTTWREAARTYLSPSALALLALGFAAGLPYMLVFSTLSVWLREAGIAREHIGFASLIGLAYAFKWIWSPLLDHLRLPVLHRLGRRRSWLLFAQLLVSAGLAGMALLDPQQALLPLIGLAVLVAFASATQDIAIDAYRIEIAEDSLQATLAATYMTGYRVAALVSGAGALYLAEGFGSSVSSYSASAWQSSYLVLALLMIPGIATTLWIKEPNIALPPTPEKRSGAQWIQQTIIAPFSDFIQRYGKQAILLLALIATYRMSDTVMGVMSNVFYIDIGYSKDTIASVSKVFGLIMTLVGAAAGGLLIARYGILPILFAGGLLSALTNLLFAYLAHLGPDTLGLVVAISADNFSGGLASAAFIAYLSSLTNVQFSATQYALFSSFMLLLPRLAGGYSGVMVEQLGYIDFFLLTTVLGIPTLLLISWLWRQQKNA